MVALSGCSATKLEMVWHDSSAHKGPLRKVLVLGLSDKESRRRAFESQFSDHFQKAGVTAIASVGKVNLGSDVSKDEVVAQIKSQDVDAVVVSRFLGVDTQTHVTPPSVTTFPETMTFGRYYATAQREVYTPGYSTQFSVYRIETNIYDATTEALIWSGTSATTDPGSADYLIKSVATAIIKDLRKQGLIEKIDKARP